MPSGVRKNACRCRRPGVRHQLEAAVDLRVHAGEVEVRAEDLGVLDLLGGRPVAELAPGSRWSPAGAGDRRCGRSSPCRCPTRKPVAELFGGDLGVELDVRALELGEVADVGDRSAGRSSACRSAPDPQPVLDDRAADLDAVVLDLDDAVALLELTAWRVDAWSITGPAPASRRRARRRRNRESDCMLSSARK